MIRFLYSFKILILFICILGYISCDSTSSASKKAKHVIVIGVDAMSPDGVQKTHTPNINQLIKTGATSMHARGVLSTSSSQNWASMIMGAGPEQHGVLTNSWNLDHFDVSPTVKDEEGYFPSIFHVLKKAYGKEIKIGVFHHWKGFGRLYNHKDADQNLHGATADTTIMYAIEYLEEKPDFIFVHLDELDHVGHAIGHGTKAFYEELENVDRQIGLMVEATKKLGIFEETVFIITADHGGIGKGHGGSSMDELEIPWIISGPGIRENVYLRDPIDTYNTASTVAFLFGVEQPYAWIGRPVKSAFIAEANQSEKMDTYIAKPRIEPFNKYIEEKAAISIQTDSEGATIHYTIDGSKPTKESKVYKDAFEVQQPTLVRAIAIQNGSQSDEERSVLNVITRKNANNISFNYYDKTISQWEDFEQLKPKKSGQLSGIDLSSFEKIEDNFIVQFKSKFNIKTAGAYYFRIKGAGYKKLIIDGKEVLSTTDNTMKYDMGNATLTSGEHLLELVFQKSKNELPFEFILEGPDMVKQLFPLSMLTK